MNQPIPPKPEQGPVHWLRLIEGHLKSIRSMLQFFVILVVLAIIIQGCSVLLSFAS